MPWILKLAVGVGLPLTVSAIFWLRYLSGVPGRDWHDAGVRFLVPPLTVIGAIPLISLALHDPTVLQPDTYPPDVEGFLVLGGVWVALVVWLVVEARRSRAHRHGVPHINRPDTKDDM